MRPASISCPYCGSGIRPTKHKRVAEHLTPGGIRCFSIGVSFKQAAHLRNQRDAFKRMT